MPPEITITEQPIADAIRGELWPLVQAHDAELTSDPSVLRLAPDVERYRAVEAAGGMFSLVMRAGATPIGYSFNYLSVPMHYAGTLLAINDAFFVAEEHRAAFGLRLMRATREAALTHGARLFCWYAKTGTPMEAILRARQCRAEETVFTEVLQ